MKQTPDTLYWIRS